MKALHTKHQGDFFGIFHYWLSEKKCFMCKECPLLANIKHSTLATHPSAHPFSLPVRQDAAATGQAELSRCPFPQQLPRAPPEGSTGAARSAWRRSPCAVRWVSPGVSSQLAVPGAPL